MLNNGTTSMKSVKPAVLFIIVTCILALLAAAAVELILGLSLTRGLRSLAVKDMYAMGTENTFYLSIDLDPSATHLKSIRVALEDITLDIDPALAGDLELSSTDPYIWGDRWPWVEKATLTLKTRRQKEGFDQLLAAEKLKQLQTDLNKGIAVGVTHTGLLTSGGRILDH